MSISFLGPRGSCEVPWIHYALLRDNVLHHLDHGTPSDTFSELYRVGQVLGGTNLFLRATKLDEELRQARTLCAEPIEQLALSARTRAVLTLKEDLPSGPPTAIVGLGFGLPWLPRGAEKLGDVFGPLIDSLLAITQDASETDTIEVAES